MIANGGNFLIRCVGVQNGSRRWGKGRINRRRGCSLHRAADAEAFKPALKVSQCLERLVIVVCCRLVFLFNVFDRNGVLYLGINLTKLFAACYNRVLTSLIAVLSVQPLSMSVVTSLMIFIAWARLALRFAFSRFIAALESPA